MSLCVSFVKYAKEFENEAPYSSFYNSREGKTKEKVVLFFYHWVLADDDMPGKGWEEKRAYTTF